MFGCLGMQAAVDERLHTCWVQIPLMVLHGRPVNKALSFHLTSQSRRFGCRQTHQRFTSARASCRTVATGEEYVWSFKSVFFVEGKGWCVFSKGLLKLGACFGRLRTSLLALKILLCRGGVQCLKLVHGHGGTVSRRSDRGFRAFGVLCELYGFRV